ncbi:MAG: hypothetical protein ABRQ37_03405 [Candidatus Eremiobacterota bacterium]
MQIFVSLLSAPLHIRPNHTNPLLLNQSVIFVLLDTISNIFGNLYDFV